MAITFHVPHPHLPHAEDFSRHSTLIMAGLLAASVAVATVVVARSTIGDSLISTSTTATEISATPLATPTKMADRFAPATVAAGSSMAVFGTDNPAIVASSAAPIAADAGELSSAALVQQSIDQALAEGHAATAVQPSSSALVQQSIDQALAERHAAVADRASRTTPTQGPGSNSLDATGVNTGSYMAAFGTDNPTIVASSAAPVVTPAAGPR